MNLKTLKIKYEDLNTPTFKVKLNLSTKNPEHLALVLRYKTLLGWTESEFLIYNHHEEQIDAFVAQAKQRQL